MILMLVINIILLILSIEVICGYFLGKDIYLFLNYSFNVFCWYFIFLKNIYYIFFYFDIVFSCGYVRCNFWCVIFIVFFDF